MADKNLEMTFLNEEGSRSGITVPTVRDNLTEAEVSVVMDAIIAGNIFSTSINKSIIDIYAKSTSAYKFQYSFLTFRNYIKYKLFRRFKDGCYT